MENGNRGNQNMGNQNMGNDRTKALDLTFHTEYGRFNYRVGAVIIHEGKLLLVRNAEAPYVYSVGGRVHFDETTEEAVIREVWEETGVLLEVERPVAFQEQIFEEEVSREHVHELGVYYLMKDSPQLDHIHCDSVTARGVSEELFWVPVEEIRQVNFVPKSIGSILENLPDHFVRIVEIDQR